MKDIGMKTLRRVTSLLLIGVVILEIVAPRGTQGAKIANNGSLQKPHKYIAKYASYVGAASWYGAECCKYNLHPGCPTASGKSLYQLEKENVPYAASWDFPLGSTLKVTNLSNGRSVQVRCLDRGPSKRFRPKRTVDLSPASFEALGVAREVGIIKAVRVEMVMP